MPPVPIIQGIELNLFYLIFLGVSIGIVSGFVGVGGGFIMTPALIIMGIPAHYAVGTSMLWVMGNSVVGTVRHRREGNVDFKLALVTMVFVISGVEAGVRMLNYMQSHGLAAEAVLGISLTILILVGSYMFWDLNQMKGDAGVRPEEGRKTLATFLQTVRIPPMVSFSKSGITISLVILAGIGLVTGVIAGFIGVGGGFLMVPSMIYLLGVPAYTAVGTDLFQIIFSAAYGSSRHIISGNVIIYVSLLLLLGSSLGVQVGTLATRYLKGICMRFILALLILISAIGSMCKLAGLVTGVTQGWLNIATISVTFGGLGLVSTLVIGLLIAGVHYCRLCRIASSSRVPHTLFKDTVV